ncbi:MAG: head GIN domain-containing protein [Dehalogenimonas sp.]
MARKEFDFSGFTGVEVRNAMKLEVKRGDQFSVAVEADDQALNDVKVSVFGGTLTAKLEARWGHIGLVFKGVSAPKLIVTMPELRSIELAAASKGEISGFGGLETFQATLSGASTLSGDVACKQLKLEAGAASHFELNGSAETADIELTAASNANLEKMTVGDARIKLGGAASMTIDVKGKLDANVSGASNLRWLGTPTLGDVKITGASSFTKKT